MESHYQSKFSFRKPAIYKIKVMGSLDEKWSNKLGGMQIKSEQSRIDSTSILIGELNDQSALSGILNTLFENHIPIISVNMLDESKTD